jgi:MoaA/NifB/PqqE/SkfB family radical SAM enzyme
MTLPAFLASEWAARFLRNELVFSAQWEVTERCKFRCPHCYLTERNRAGANAGSELSFVEAVKLLDQLVELGALFITFTGGEVFLYPCFLELCAEARKRGLGVRILSNGSFIGDAEARRLEALGVLSVELTLYAASRDGYRRATGYAPGFRALVEAVRALQRHGVPVILKTFYSRVNADEAEGMEAVARRLGISLERSYPLLPRFDDGRVPLEAGLTRDQARRLADLLEEPAWVDDYDRNREATLCGRCGRTRLFLTATGDVTPCGATRHVVLGNVRTQPLVDLWRSPRVQEKLALLDLEGTKTWQTHRTVDP